MYFPGCDVYQYSDYMDGGYPKMKGTYVKIETRRFVFERTPVGWNLESKVTGEVILWDHMFKHDPYDMAHVYSTSFKNFIRNVKEGWKHWFFGTPYNETHCTPIETDEGCWINGSFCPVDELPF